MKLDKRPPPFNNPETTYHRNKSGGEIVVACLQLLNGEIRVGKPAYIIRGAHPVLGKGPAACLTSPVQEKYEYGFKTENTWYQYQLRNK